MKNTRSSSARDGGPPNRPYAAASSSLRTQRAPRDTVRPISQQRPTGSYRDFSFRCSSRAEPDQLALFAQSLGPEDRVGLETTGNALSIARIIEPHVAGVLVADTRNVRAMTHAKVKNDRIDAQMIAKLLAAGMLPGTWICDEQTRILRRQVTRRAQLVRGRTRARNQIHAIVIRNLSGRGPTGDRRDLAGADGLAVVLVLGAEDDALLGGHDPPNLPTALTGWLGERPVLTVDQSPAIKSLSGG